MIDFFKSHVDLVSTYTQRNPRFVFFRKADGPPRGSINEPVTNAQRRDGTFYLDYDKQTGEPHWRLADEGEDMFGKKIASIYGDQKRYGSSLTDPVFGFASGATLGTAKGFLTTAKFIEDALTGNIGDKLDGYFNNAINYLTQKKLSKSNEVVTLDVFLGKYRKIKEEIRELIQHSLQD